jgi:ribose transport system ATP-binding protein
VPHSAPAIEMRGIEKSFGSNAVLKSVDFEVLSGEVHALVGENGAGKSTLMKILQGVYSSDSGAILVAGQPVSISNAAEAKLAGIGMVFQEFSLVPSLTVAENIFLTDSRINRLGFVDDASAVSMARELFAEMGVRVDVKTLVEKLPTAMWQLTEIAKALAQKAKVLILDEPTASLAKHEADALFALIERLKNQGIAIVYISHRMDEIYRIADRITVLRDGEKVLTDSLSSLTSAEIVEAIIGRRHDGHLAYQRRENKFGARIVLEVSDLLVGSNPEGISLTVSEGEIVGLAGLMGSGRTELVSALFGTQPVESGKVIIDGTLGIPENPRAAIARGLALIPEDRRAQGLVLDHSVAENITLPLLKQVSRQNFIVKSKAENLTAKVIESLSIKLASPLMKVGSLSGGNQQKVVIGKWLGTAPRILMLDEPTAGVDIGTKTEILDLIRDIANNGTTVIFISSELPELLSVSDRIVVLRDGAVAYDFDRIEIADEETLQLAIQGVSVA